jgi:hypothetical protein
MSDAPKANLCRRGVWQREEQSGYVFITYQDWDYYFDEYTDGEPDVGPDGLAYYALYGSVDDVGSASSRSPTCLTEDEAVERAEALVGPINWLSRNPGRPFDTVRRSGGQ